MVPIQVSGPKQYLQAIMPTFISWSCHKIHKTQDQIEAPPRSPACHIMKIWHANGISAFGIGKISPQSLRKSMVFFNQRCLALRQSRVSLFSAGRLLLIVFCLGKMGMAWHGIAGEKHILAEICQQHWHWMQGLHNRSWHSETALIIINHNISTASSAAFRYSPQHVPLMYSSILFNKSQSSRSFRKAPYKHWSCKPTEWPRKKC